MKKALVFVVVVLTLGTLVSCKQQADVFDVRYLPTTETFEYYYEVSGSYRISDYDGYTTTLRPTNAVVSWQEDVGYHTNLKEYEIDLSYSYGGSTQTRLIHIMQVGSDFYFLDADTGSQTAIEVEGDIGGSSFSLTSNSYTTSSDGYTSTVPDISLDFSKM